MVKINKLFKDFKFYIAAFTLVCAITGTVFGFFNLPTKVEAVEKKQEETEDKVQKLANTVDKYIAVQEAKEESADKQKQILLDLLGKLAEK